MQQFQVDVSYNWLVFPFFAGATAACNHARLKAWPDQGKPTKGWERSVDVGKNLFLFTGQEEEKTMLGRLSTLTSWKQATGRKGS